MSRLSAAATNQANNRQYHGPADHGDNLDDPAHHGSGNDTQPEEPDHSEQVKTRAARHSKSTGEARPDTLKYYKGTSWNSVLENAKMKYRRHIALYHGFPDRDTDLGDATKLIAEAIAEFEDNDGILDDGEFILTS